MPGLYHAGEYDLAGFIVGAVERDRLITGKTIRAGDVLLGLPSTGLHTNGYSLARKLFFEVAGHRPETFVPELGCDCGGRTAQSAPQLPRRHSRAGRDRTCCSGAAHITGGGITGNTPRMLPDGLAAAIDTGSWKVPPVFELLRNLGGIPEDDWRRTFNLGVGMILAVPAANAAKAETIAGDGMPSAVFRIGEVVEARPRRQARGSIYR